jgi:hypothetical protein
LNLGTKKPTLLDGVNLESSDVSHEFFINRELRYK